MAVRKKPRQSGTELTAKNYRALAEFRFVLRRFLAFSEDAARAAGLTPQQHQALLAIKGFDSATQPTIGALAEQLSIRHHSAVGLVDRLVKVGHLKRNADPVDRRFVTLTLTASGEAVLAELTTAHRDELRMLTPSLKALFSTLER